MPVGLKVLIIGGVAFTTLAIIAAAYVAGVSGSWKVKAPLNWRTVRMASGVMTPMPAANRLASMSHALNTSYHPKWLPAIICCCIRLRNFLPASSHLTATNTCFTGRDQIACIVINDQLGTHRNYGLQLGFVSCGKFKYCIMLNYK